MQEVSVAGIRVKRHMHEAVHQAEYDGQAGWIVVLTERCWGWIPAAAHAEAVLFDLEPEDRAV